MFTDSQIAKQYQCAKAKTFCIWNDALAPSFHEKLVRKMKSSSFFWHLMEVMTVTKTIPVTVTLIPPKLQTLLH